MTQNHYFFPELERVHKISSALLPHQVYDILQDQAKISDDSEIKAAQAVALFISESISTEDIIEQASHRVDSFSFEKETFVPIFMTNYCHSECKMCGMRESNTELIRKFSGKKKIEEQLTILREVDGVSGVGFLTGEYQDKFTRYVNAFYTGWAINTAIELGFEQVFFNIGSMTSDEIDVLREWLPQDDERITMCVFQETYNIDQYEKYMGKHPQSIPKADFDRRIDSFDNWLDAGFKTINLGFLVGLSSVKEELAHILLHTAHYTRREAKIYISLPRLRPALGASKQNVISDEEYIRLIATLAYFSPETGIVLTTRETMEFQDRALPLIRVLSPGSPDVSPYQWNKEAPNNEYSSQFLIPDHRRPKDILQRICKNGYRFKQFKPIM